MMKHAPRWARRMLAIGLALAVPWIVLGVVAFAVNADSYDRAALILLLAVLGGLFFFVWVCFRILRGIVRLFASPHRPERGGLGSDYEEMVSASGGQRGRRRG